MSKPDYPAPPDPYKTAGAQTGTNVATSIANQQIGNVNQVTPQGSLTYDQSGTYSFEDPTTGKTFDVPTYTATTEMSPELKALYDKGLATQSNLADIGNEQTSKIGELLNDPFSLGDPGINAPNLSGNLPDAGDIQRSYGDPGSYADQRQRVEDALMARMDPYLTRQRDALETRLANQGLELGSEAHSRAMFDQGRVENDARLAAILGAGDEQTRLAGLDAARAGFANQAQGQAFGQGMSTVDFANQIGQQGFANDTTLANFLAQRAITERNQPLNEITALMSGSQVSSPQFGIAPQPQVPTVDIAGLINDNYAQQMNIAGLQNDYNSQLYGGILGAGAKILGGRA